MTHRINETTNELCLLTIKQAAERLCCSAACVYALIAGGELPVVRIGLNKGFRIDAGDLVAFVNGRKAFRYRAEIPPNPNAKFKHLRR